MLAIVPTHEYPFERGGAPRLAISRAWGVGDAVVAFDGRRVRTVESARLAAGVFLDLRDGSTIYLRSANGFLWGVALEVTRDGRPLPGSATDLELRVDSAMSILLFLGVLNVLAGIGARVFAVDFLVERGVTGANIALGVLYGGMGLILKFGRSRVALGIAILLMLSDTLYLLATGSGPGIAAAIGGLAARSFFLIPLVRAFGALRQLRVEDEPDGIYPRGSALLATPQMPPRAASRPRAPADAVSPAAPMSAERPAETSAAVATARPAAHESPAAPVNPALTASSLADVRPTLPAPAILASASEPHSPASASEAQFPASASEAHTLASASEAHPLASASEPHPLASVSEPHPLDSTADAPTLAHQPSGPGLARPPTAGSPAATERPAVIRLPALPPPPVPPLGSAFFLYGLLLTGLLFGGGIISVSAGIAIFRRGQGKAELEALLHSPQAFGIGAALAVTVGLVLVSFFALRAHEPIRDTLRLRSYSGVVTDALLATVATVALGTALETGARLLDVYDGSVLAKLAKVAATAPLQTLALAAIPVALAGVSEELVFRGFIQRRFGLHWRRSTAVVVTSVLFGVMHMEPLHLVFATAIGVLFGWIAELEESIVPCLVAHVLNNALAFPLNRWMPLPSDSPDLVLVLAASLGATAAMVALLAVRHRRRSTERSRGPSPHPSNAGPLESSISAPADPTRLADVGPPNR